MQYRIRAHHGMCFSYFQGKGYSGEFVDNMWRMKERLSREAEVVLLVETDDVCAHCPNNQAGTCTSSEKTADYDRRVLDLCGLEAGAQLRWTDFEELVREHILSCGKREEICGDCEWSGLCKE